MYRFAIERLEGRALFASYSATDVPQLIAAINTANASTQSDTITLPAGTNFSLTAVDNTTDSATGLPIIVAGAGGLTIVGNGSTIERSAAAGTPWFRLFDVAAGAGLELKNLTLQGGAVVGAPFVTAPDGEITGGPGQGGAIRNNGGLYLGAVTLQNNTAEGFVGSAPFGTPLRGGDGMGGGIYSAGSLELHGCTIRNNFAIGGEGRGGFSTFIGTSYSGARGGDACGGGVYIADGTASISFSDLIANTCIGGAGGAQGGGRYAGSGGDGLGGGLFAADGELRLRNVTITSNRVQGGAGGDGRSAKGIGQAGNGVGDALYFEPAAYVLLNLVTLKSAKKGHIFGSYTVTAFGEGA